MPDPSVVRTVRFPAAIIAAAIKHCEDHGLTLNYMVLVAVCHEIGKPELVESIRPPGRQHESK